MLRLEDLIVTFWLRTAIEALFFCFLCFCCTYAVTTQQVNDGKYNKNVWQLQSFVWVVSKIRKYEIILCTWRLNWYKKKTHTQITGISFWHFNTYLENKYDKLWSVKRTMPFVWSFWNTKICYLIHLIDEDH